jgi:serine/threonine protein kinase/tetratricopeptide (TPR) repeat protein
MNPDRWRQIEALYHAALERAPEDRAAFLDEACAGDGDLRREITSLLAYDERAAHFITSPPDAVAAEMLTAEPAPAFIGSNIHQYRILSSLGRGGMGEVYLAEDARLGRKVAVKLLPSEFTADVERVRRFEREARAASALNHPNILTIHDIGETDGRRFMISEFVEGETLRARMASGAMEISEALEIARQTASALSVAHRAGIVHCDIKPENLMLRPDGFVKVLDFGLAKLTEEGQGEKGRGGQGDNPLLLFSSTTPGVVMGTVHYMSPEQARGRKLDARTDLFSLGVTLYEMLAGRRPFAGETTSDCIAALLGAEPPPLRTHCADAPAQLEQIIGKCLAKDREARFQSAEELIEALRNAGQDAVLIREVADPAFVGREAELSRLDQMLASATGGAGRIVFITGEAGLGKTALAERFLRRARASRHQLLVARGRCLEQHGPGEAFLPFLDALGALLFTPERERIAAALRDHAPTWCLQFPAAFRAGGAWEQLQQETIGATRERMLREMGDVLEALAAATPVVLLLEDLHWADPSSIDLLNHLSHRIHNRRVLLAATFRAEEADLRNPPLRNFRGAMHAHQQCEEIALGLLDETHLAAYLDARFSPNDFPAELPALIARKTEGHPLFAVSLAQFLAERGDLAQAGDDRWTLTRPLSDMDLEAPENVRSLIRGKMDSLDEADRQALQYASIEGEEFTSTVLAELLGQDELGVEERLDRLDKLHRLVVTLGEEELPDGRMATRYRFAHVLYQNHLHESLVPKRRSLLHRQTGESLLRHYGGQAARIAARLAAHFEQGRDFPRAVEFLIHAGDNARRLYAHTEAAEFHSRALELLDKLPVEEQGVRRFTLHHLRGQIYFALSRFDRAQDDFTRMLDCARALAQPRMECAALNALAHVLFFDHRLDEMGLRAGESLRAAEAAGDEALRIEALTLIARRNVCLGHLDEAIPMLEECLRVARPLDHRPALLFGLAWRGLCFFFQSEYDPAEANLAEAVSLSAELRDSFMFFFCLFFLGLTRGERGRITEALATFDEAIRLARRNGEQYKVLKIPNSLGWLHRELEDHESAFEHDRIGLDVSRQHKLLEAEINSIINLSHDYLNRGEQGRADSAFREAENLLRQDDWFRWRFNIRLQAGRCKSLLSRGETAPAEDCARRLLAIATHHGARKYMAEAHRLLADAAVAREDFAGAEAALRAALDVLRAHPTPLLAWRLHAALGRLHARMGRTDAAREAFAEAAAIIQTIAGHINDDRLRTVFLNSAAVRDVLRTQPE